MADSEANNENIKTENTVSDKVEDIKTEDAVSHEMSKVTDSQDDLLKLNENPGNQQQPAVIMVQLSNAPVHMTCPYCGKQIVTRTSSEISNTQHIFCLIMFLTSMWCCSCVPYLYEPCANTRHECPNCNAYLGTSSAR